VAASPGVRVAESTDRLYDEWLLDLETIAKDDGHEALVKTIAKSPQAYKDRLRKDPAWKKLESTAKAASATKALAHA
jgi:hypothetical protein